MRTFITTTCAALIIGAGTLASAGDIPGHPSELSFEELVFTPPAPSEFRHELSNGTPVFMAASKEFPLVTISLSFKGGEYMEGAGQAGLAAMTGAMMRSGGSSMMSPGDLDEEFDYMAANVSAGIGG